MLRILHLPWNIGGNTYGLSSHLKQVGVVSEMWTFKQNYFNYRSDLFICRSNDNLLLCEIKRLLALRYVFKSDVVFFNFGSTLFQQLPKKSRSDHISLFGFLFFAFYRRYAKAMQFFEIFLLKIQKKIILIMYQGDDARQGCYLLSTFPISIASQVEAGYYTPESDALKREQINFLTSVCFKTYALNPDLLRLLPSGSEFLPYSHISLDDWSPCYTQMESRPLRIGHAPSHRGVKGTDLILEAFAALEAEHFDFEIVLIEGLSNSEAKERYKTVDVVVDQLFAGWYGGLAVEAMALGKPVIVYIRDEDLQFIPPEMVEDLPFIRAKPDNIQSILRDVLTMPREHLLDLAKQSRVFVERWHNPIDIANRIKDDILQAVST